MPATTTQPTSRYTTFTLPACLLHDLDILTRDGRYSKAETLLDIVTLAAMYPDKHRPRAPLRGRVKHQFTDRPGSPVRRLLWAQGLALSQTLESMLRDPLTADRLDFWRMLTPAEQRYDFRRAAAKANLAGPVPARELLATP